MRHLIVGFFLCLLPASSAFAQVTNGNFNSGMTGWTTSATPPVSVYFHPFGLPANAALIDGGLNNTGSGSLSQTFYCGAAPGTGSCAIAFDYFINSSSVTVLIEAVIDGSTVYSALYPAEPADWVHAAANVACGQHTLTIRATSSNVGFAAVWQVWVDNVTGVCEPPIPAESSTWGSIKALYR